MLNGLAVTLVVTNIFSGIGVRMIRPSPIEPSVNWAQPGRGTGISVTQSGSSEICHSMTQTGGATTFNLGGTKPYSDVLWSYPVVGPASVLDLPDPNKTLVPNAKNFIYDAYFFSSTIGAAQVLEFDVSQYFGGKSLIYGSQCRIAGGHA